jgi:hypothetical protein
MDVTGSFVDLKSLATMSHWGRWWVTNMLVLVLQTLSPFTGTCVLVQKLGGNVVDFVFKTFVSIITHLGYVGDKPC